MKKLLLTLLVLVLSVSMSACSSNKSEPVANMTNPVVEYGSLEEINALTGANFLKLPVMGVADEKFSVISDEIAEYTFAVNGVEYCLRYGKVDEDISGIYEDGKQIFAEHVHNQRDVYCGKDYKSAIWCDKEGTYVLTIKDNGTYSDEQFESVLNEVVSLVTIYTSEDLSGCWYDVISERATMMVERADDDTYLITVSWSESADKTNEWTMTATVNGNTLFYSDCTHKIYEGNDETVECGDCETGYFTAVENALMWNGSSDEATQSCVFTRPLD